MEKFYCKYCGTSNSSIRNLTAGTCPRHPDGPRKGPHALYEGGEKKEYTCKYCGTSSPTISNLTGLTCSKHPNGSRKGYHSPAL